MLTHQDTDIPMKYCYFYLVKYRNLFMRLYLLVLFSFFFKVIVNGQKTKIETDSLMIISLNHQASKFITLEPDSGIYFGELALKVGFRSNHYEHLNESHRIVGWCYYNQQNFVKAKFHLQYALNDSGLNAFERNKIYEALINASEKTGDYQPAYLYLKNLTYARESVNRQKQKEALVQLQSQLSEKQKESEDELKKKERIWQMIKTRQQQLLVIAAIACVVLLLFTVILFFMMHRNRKTFNEILEEKNILIAETNDQSRKLQNQIAGYEKLKFDIAKDKREGRVQELVVEEPKQEIPEEKKWQTSIIDQYENAGVEERKKLLPKLESFAMIIPTQLQIIEQAFARHDWEMINNTLQSIKSIVHAAGLSQTETLINEINEHVNAKATNRAVVKLLQVKSACTKTVNAIKKNLESA